MPEVSGMSATESALVRATFKATMLRAAAIIEKITESDVTEMQARLLATGSTLEQVARLDRLMLAVAYLRSCAAGEVRERGGTLAAKWMPEALRGS